MTYVDDVEIHTGPWGMQIIEKIRVDLEMDPPELIQRFLGCLHQIKITGKPGAQLTTVTYAMVEYFQTAVEEFSAETAVTFNQRSVDTPYAPSVSDPKYTKLIAAPGELATKALSFLTKLLYGARIVLPTIITAVQKLACFLDTPKEKRWSPECDRQLTRVYQFLAANPKQVLTGELSEEDKDILELWFLARP